MEEPDKTFVIIYTIVVDRTTYEPHLPAHLDYLQTLKQRGVLLLSGPFTDRSGGMIMIRAASYDAAETIARNDPLVSSGVDRYQLHEWRLTDGAPQAITLQPR